MRICRDSVDLGMAFSLTFKNFEQICGQFAARSVKRSPRAPGPQAHAGLPSQVPLGQIGRGGMR
jgi:hypothetical protein